MVTANVRLKRRLGEGGMGAVWVAEHLGLHTDVAVKFIFPELLQREPALAARFSAEAQVASRIKDPHVVQIFDHGTMSDGTPFIVMELLEGENLAARIVRASLAPAEAAAIVDQTANALAKAHALGIVHRDIKPENLFLTDSAGELFVKILDFGIAKQSDTPARALTSTGDVFGTPTYMSPEQLLDSKAIDGQADLWALAVSAYEMLTQALPFTGATPAAIAVAVCAAKFTSATIVRADLPADVDAWFARALARDPAERFDAPQDFARDFAAALRVTREELRPASLRGASDQSQRSKVETLGLMSATTTVTVRHAKPGNVRIALGIIAFGAAAGALVPFAIRAARTPTVRLEATSAPVGADKPPQRVQQAAAPPTAISTHVDSLPAAAPSPRATVDAAPIIAAEPPRSPRPTASTAASATVPPPTGKPTFCDKPFYVDASGIRRVRRECL